MAIMSTGMHNARILRNIEGIAHIELDEDDVVRHKLVKAILRAYEKERTDYNKESSPREGQGKQ